MDDQAEKVASPGMLQVLQRPLLISFRGRAEVHVGIWDQNLGKYSGWYTVTLPG